MSKQASSQILELINNACKHKKLTNFNVANVTGDLYRIRIGDYRAIYTIEDDILRVLVVKVAHRKEVYE